jgi:hypothetical protein
MAAEWATVVGTLGGAMTGAGGAWLLEKTRGKRETKARWDETRRVLYGRFLASLADVFNTGTLAIVRLNRRAQQGEAPDRVNTIERTHQLLADAAAQAAAIALVGTGGISERAWGVVQCSQSLLNLAIDHHTTESEEWKTSHSNYRAARDEFVQAARDELGIV